MGRLDTPGYAFEVAVRDTLAFVADGNSSGLRIIDVAVPAWPVEVGRLVTGSCAYGVDVAGSVACVADQYDGLRVIDISVPESPHEVGHYNTASYVNGVCIRDGLIYTADLANGMEVFEFYGTGLANETRASQCDEFRLWPSVTGDGRVTLSWNLPAVGTPHVRIFDAAGRLAMTRTLTGGHATLDVSELLAGVYLVQLESGGRRSIRKLVRRQN